MTPDQRRSLTKALSSLSVAAAADLRQKILASPALRDRAEALHGEERVGQDFTLWTDLLARRAAVMWVLRSVYVRVLEDRGLMPPRLLDREDQSLFEQLAPDLGAAAFLTWLYRDLAKGDGGLAELFTPTASELTAPGDALAQRLLNFWRDVDPDSGELRWRFDSESFDSRLLGDLYQDLDPEVKKRYALLQTPDFVVDFMLDETLGKLLAGGSVAPPPSGGRSGGGPPPHNNQAPPSSPPPTRLGPLIQVVSLIDPACGSGHFLLAGFDRIYTAMRAAFPDMSPLETAQDVLGRVVGIDINDYACALARARLLMHALQAAGCTDLSLAKDFHPQVFCADGLDQVERELPDATPTGELRQLGLGEQLDMAPLTIPTTARPMAALTPAETRDRLRPVLQAGFHVVVANPPYITESDELRKAYHKQNVAGNPRYVSAHKLYSLVCPFTERCFQLARPQGRVALIVANSFMKREFGKALVEEFLPSVTLTKVIDTSGAYLPGHGTPTVILFGRRGMPQAGDRVRTVMGKRGEPKVPTDPAKGQVWSSIVAGHDLPGYETEFVSVADLPEAVFAKHPWSLQGGGADTVQARVEDAASTRLTEIAQSIGFMCITKQDDVFAQLERDLLRYRCSPTYLRPFGIGEDVRDWAVSTGSAVVFPYDHDVRTVPLDQLGPTGAFLWPYRRVLEARKAFGGAEYRDIGKPWYEFGQIPADKLRSPLSITFAFVATHNHFVLDRGGKVFKQTAPVIKLPPDAGEDAHLGLLGLLNASVGCFWMKQVLFERGGGGIGGGIASEDWERFYEHDSTKLLQFPIPTPADPTLIDFARRLDALATARVADTVTAAIDDAATQGHAALATALAARRERDIVRLRRMVALQEELDWYAYGLYGIAADLPVISPEVVAGSPGIIPGQRTFEIVLARHDVTLLEAIARGEDPGESPTAWFARHGWEPVTEVADIGDAAGERYRDVVQQRLDLIAEHPSLALLEQPTYKRRWARPGYEAQEREALDAWLLDRLEAWAKGRDKPWTVGQAAVAMEAEEVRAVCRLRSGRDDFSLTAELKRLVAEASVPNCKAQVYKGAGLEKRAAWERTWQLQHAQDRGETVDVPVPPRYAPADFARPTYWRLRGKLDVPKERFVAFAEMPGSGGDSGGASSRTTAPGAAGDSALYGWAGWTPLRRAMVLLALDEQAQDQGVPLGRRYGLLYGIQFLLPWVGWESPAAQAELRTILRQLLGEGGVSEAMLAQWAGERA